MNTIRYIIQKEFIQIFRNKTMLPIIFILPIVQLLILVFAATLEMKNIDIVVVDQDLSVQSRKLISKFEGSPFFKVNYASFSMKEAEELIATDKAIMILNIPAGFEKELFKNNSTKLQILINAINGVVAGLSNSYAQAVIMDFNKNVSMEYMAITGPSKVSMIDISKSYWYNPLMNYKIYMVPAILVILVSMIGMFLSALNLVREKEMGTIEQINVTPIKKYQFIIGKLLPFWLIALFELAFGLTIGKLLFDIPIIGSLPLLFGFASIYLLAVLALGLLISSMSSTQQQVMFVSFFILLTFIMMSGIFTPTESMPVWAQKLNIINPFAYFMEVIRMILLKGSNFANISKQFMAMSIYAVIALSFAIWRYRKIA